MLTRRAGKLALSVIEEMSGRGFDVAKTRRGQSTGKHLGLVGMEERVQGLGGTVTLQSTPGSGTTLVVELPFEGQEQP